MKRFYTATLHRRCDKDGCLDERRLGVRDSKHGEIGKFCETHALDLVKKLNAAEEVTPPQTVDDCQSYGHNAPR